MNAPLNRDLSPATEEPSIPDLLRRLTDQGAHLAQQQVALVKAEVTDSVNDVKAAIAAYAGAAVLGIASIGVLLMGLAYLLTQETELRLWQATLIIGAASALLAFILYKSAASKLSASSLAPERSMRTIERTPDAATGNL